MSIILPVVIFVSWLAFVIIPAGKIAIEDERNKVPKDKRRGTSIFPGFPVFPLLAWAIAVVADQFITPWGSRTVLVLHVLLLLVSLSIIIRDILLLRRIGS